MEEKLLELKDVHVHYGGVKALDGASVEIDEGEVVALMGPNGAGKSTILKAIFGLAPIERGAVKWEGQTIKPVSHEVVRRGITFVPQGRRVFRHLTVKENIEVGGWGLSKKIIKERLEMFYKFSGIGKLHAKSARSPVVNSRCWHAWPDAIPKCFAWRAIAWFSAENCRRCLKIRNQWTTENGGMVVGII